METIRLIFEGIGLWTRQPAGTPPPGVPKG